MASGMTSTSSSMTQNHWAPSFQACCTPAEKPPAPPVFSYCGTQIMRSVPPSASASAAPQSSVKRLFALCTSASVAGDASLSMTMMRHGACVRVAKESKRRERSSCRLYVTTTMAKRSRCS